MNRKRRSNAKANSYYYAGGKFYPLGNENGELLVLQSFRNITQILPEEIARVLGVCKEFNKVQIMERMVK